MKTKDPSLASVSICTVETVADVPSAYQKREVRIRLKREVNKKIAQNKLKIPITFEKSGVHRCFANHYFGKLYQRNINSYHQCFW
jgi:hypothetical protein